MKSEKAMSVSATPDSTESMVVVLFAQLIAIMKLSGGSVFANKAIQRTLMANALTLTKNMNNHKRLLIIQDAHQTAATRPGKKSASVGVDSSL